MEEEAFAIGGAVGVVLTGGVASGSGGAPRSSPADGRDDSAGGGKGDAAGSSGSNESGGVKGIAATGAPPAAGSTGIALTLLVVLLISACVLGLGLETRRMWRSGAGID